MTALVALACAPYVLRFDGPRAGASADTDTGVRTETAAIDSVPACLDEEVLANGLDDDCDGRTDEQPVPQEWTVVGEGTGAAIGDGQLLAPGDLDGDDAVDVLISATGDDSFESNAGGFAIHDADDAAKGVGWSQGWLRVTGGDPDDGVGIAVGLFVRADGSPRLVVGEPGHDESSDAGAVYIVDTEGLTGAAEVGDARDGRIEGLEGNGALGTGLAVGDLDGDGIADLVVGAPEEQGHAGRVYVFVSADWWWETDHDTSLASLVAVGVQPNDRLGTGLRYGGDLTGDGYGDVLACASGFDADEKAVGACWVIGGGSFPTGPVEEEEQDEVLVSAVAEAAFVGAQRESGLGASMRGIGLGDIDGDGSSDVAIGAPGTTGTSEGGGLVAVWFGGALAGTYSAEEADARILGDGALGTALAIGADLDGDGTLDLLAGAPTAGGQQQGIVYAVLDLAAGELEAPTQANSTWLGEAAGDAFGTSVAVGSDLKRDGTPWAIVSAPGADAGGLVDAGRVYLFPAGE
jgi:hypothetical protein